MAGLWESWRSDQPDGLETFTIITTDANEVTSTVHDRMPVIVTPEDYSMWLDPDFESTAALEALLRPFPSDQIEADAVSKHVNNTRNDDPGCIEPIRD
jgi:putative SOS response-associated peptidase YedK